MNKQERAIFHHLRFRAVFRRDEWAAEALMRYLINNTPLPPTDLCQH